MGKWVLNLDADEFIIYSEMKQKGLRQLQDWLQARDKSSLCMPIIDMYPEHITRQSADVTLTQSLEDLIEESPYFDRLKKGLDSTCWVQNSHRGIELKGGIRRRMMHDIGIIDSPWVNVIPLARWCDQTAYYSGSRHTVFPRPEHDEYFYAALLHFKFVGDFGLRVAEAIQNNQYWNNSLEYRRYAEWMIYHGNQTLLDDAYSVKFKDEDSLIRERLLQPINWDCNPLPCP
jgi:hypothetical protein